VKQAHSWPQKANGEVTIAMHWQVRLTAKLQASTKAVDQPPNPLPFTSTITTVCTQEAASSQVAKCQVGKQLSHSDPPPGGRHTVHCSQGLKPYPKEAAPGSCPARRHTATWCSPPFTGAHASATLLRSSAHSVSHLPGPRTPSHPGKVGTHPTLPADQDSGRWLYHYKK
jgi:hypothetical protein